MRNLLLRLFGTERSFIVRGLGSFYVRTFTQREAVRLARAYFEAL